MVLGIDYKNEPKLFKCDPISHFPEKDDDLEELRKLMRNKKEQNEELKA